MQAAALSLDHPWPPTTRRLAERMVSPLAGLDRMVGIVMRGAFDPRFMVAGGELTGVHLLVGDDHPGSYHIGGTGLAPHEALIRTFGETVERYAQLISAVRGDVRLCTETYDEMRAAGRTVPPVEDLCFFSDEQLASPGFRFDAFSPSAPMTWVAAAALPGGDAVWVPAQLALVGYRPRRHEGEPWLFPAVTTGTAAHTNPPLALRGALLELIQIDAGMGHWYSSARAPEILLDERVTAVRAIIRRHCSVHRPAPRFFWIASPDLPGAIVACVLRNGAGKAPAAVVGLGVDLRLGPALYKALLEAVGVLQLAKINLISASLDGDGPHQEDNAILDLDTNVALYADPAKAGVLDEKFGGEEITASDHPPDVVADPLDEVRLLADAFARTGKPLAYLDLTTEDVRSLGFVVVRAWCGKTLSMPLPSAPPKAHRRFEAYGGATDGRPHPYP